MNTAKIRAALMAKHLCNVQPPHVRNRLLCDATFGEHFGLGMRTVINVGGTVHIEKEELVTAARRAVVNHQTETLVDLDGDEVYIKIEKDLILLESATKDIGARLDHLMVLSPERETRTQALENLIDHLGPAAPGFSALLTEAQERELTDEEIMKLLDEVAIGVGAFQARATASFDTDQATLENLVPDSLVYFERFCGPNPGDTDPEEYLGTLLPQYRKDLIRRNLVRGLDICLQGALRDDLMPAEWTGNLNNDELWNALELCDSWRDPIALLGALDIALYRQNDERYRGFAEQAVTKLTEEKFSRPDGNDAYELLPLLAEVVLNRINTLEGGTLRPPFWKRMCAWMQAGFLLRLTQNISLDLESFSNWVSNNLTTTGMYAKTLDLRYEPMYRAVEMSPRAFREEVLGRLLLIRSRHEAAERMVPGLDNIDKALSRLANQGSRLGLVLPGPLEGHRLPAEGGANRRLADDDIKKVEEALADDSATPFFYNLSYLSQFYDLGEDVLLLTREAVKRIDFDSEEMTDPDELFGRLFGICLIACAQRDTELARAIASKVMLKAHRPESAHDVIRILNILLVVSAAFKNELEWAEWLEGQLLALAIRLPAGEPSKVLLEYLEELKRVIKLNLGITVRAEALASAAN